MSMMLYSYLINFGLSPEDANTLIKVLAQEMRPGRDVDIEKLASLLEGYGVPRDALRYVVGF